jgi:amino acid transporter
MRFSTRMFGTAVGIVLGLSLAAAATPTLDLTAAGSSGFVNGAFFQQTDAQPAGSAYIRSFVRLSTNQPIEQGYNTEARQLEFDENSSPQFTRSLLLSDVPVVDKAGTAGVWSGRGATCLSRRDARSWWPGCWKT